VEPPIDITAKRRLALAEERLDELVANHVPYRHDYERSELEDAIEEFHIASVEAGEIDLKQLISNLKMSGLNVPKGLLEMQS
jgi:hypothetical protein